MAPDPEFLPSEPAGKPSFSRYHSRYYPYKEARRHLDAVLDGKTPAIVFILGGGLNYLGADISRRFPHAITVSVQPCDDFTGQEVCTADYYWAPSSAVPLRSILRSALSSGKLAGGIALVEWPPVVSRFQKEADLIRGELLRYLNEESADAATIGFWAGRWIRNCVRFAGNASGASIIRKGTGPLILACAGPSLTEALPAIKAARDDIALWALASAVPALLGAGIQPDLAISTDPGFWNGYHVRAACVGGIPIAMAPSSFCPGMILERSMPVALDTGMLFEKAAIDAARVPSEKADPSGSAAGTALSLALAATSGAVALAGYDLAAKDLEDHARPYPFDILDTIGESRLKPVQSARATRVLDGFPLRFGTWRGSKSFSTYASKIAVRSSDANRVYRIGDSPVETRIPRGDLEELLDGRGEPPQVSRISESVDAKASERREAVAVMLDNLIEGAAASARAAIESGVPLPFNASLLFKALAPRSSAAFIADAARCAARTVDLDYAVEDARASAARLAGSAS